MSSRIITVFLGGTSSILPNLPLASFLVSSSALTCSDAIICVTWSINRIYSTTLGGDAGDDDDDFLHSFS